MAKSPLYLVAVIKPRMDAADQVEARLRIMMAATRDEPGCEYMELVVSDSEPDTWFMFEKFHSRPDWDVHMTLPHVLEGNEILGPLLREPTVLNFYTEK